LSIIDIVTLKIVKIIQKYYLEKKEICYYSFSLAEYTTGKLFNFMDCLVHP